MLVITRKAGESVHIGDNIVVAIARTNRGEVRLAIEAPREVKILRSELIDGKKKEGTEK